VEAEKKSITETGRLQSGPR